LDLFGIVGSADGVVMRLWWWLSGKIVPWDFDELLNVMMVKIYVVLCFLCIIHFSLFGSFAAASRCIMVWKYR
jgi:hypothetical protein